MRGGGRGEDEDGEDEDGEDEDGEDEDGEDETIASRGGGNRQNTSRLQLQLPETRQQLAQLPSTTAATIATALARTPTAPYQLPPTTMPSLRQPAALTALLRPSLHPPPYPLPLRTFTQHLSRPRLPPLLRTSLPPPALPPRIHAPPRRLISAKTKAYLIRESLIAARIVTYGYSFLFASALVATTALLITTEHSHPTASTLPWRVRAALTLSRALTTWSTHRAATTLSLRLALEELDLHPAPADPFWRHAHVQTLHQLAGLSELDDDVDVARGLWLRVLHTPDADPAMRVAAGLRVAKIAEFRRDDGAAEAALRDAVAAAGEGEALLKALTETAVFHARRGAEEVALELLTRVLAVQRAAGSTDPCAEAATMTYIGEVLFALGERRQGVAWSKEAFERSAGLAELRAKCKECAIVAGRNLSAMAALMEQETGREGRKAGRFSRFFANPETEAVESVEKWEEAVSVLEQIRVSKGL